jgi:GMP synthase-like glutamine amidotransferase
VKPVLIVRHEDWLEAGHIVDVLDAEGIAHELCAIDQGNKVPEDPDAWAGLVFVGGSMSVNDGYPWIDDEVELIRRAYDQDIPVLGHCFGSQLCARALGAPVREMSQKEIGWHRIRRKDTPAAREWLGNGPDEADIFIWHHDAFDLPPGAEALYSTNYCPDQAFAAGNLVATVAHTEITADLLRRWIDIFGYDLDPVSETVQSQEQVLDHVEEKVEAMQRDITNPIYERWLRPVRERAGA